MNPKLAIIVPYRDREEHLAQFVPHMEKFLSQQDIDFKLFIIEQGDENAFNRGSKFHGTMEPWNQGSIDAWIH